MQFQEDYSQTRIRINAWEPGFLIINGKKYQHNTILTENEILTIPLPQSVQQISVADIEQYCSLGAEVILLGTGMKQQFPARKVLETATAHNIAIEVMDTMAACRIFSLLAGEGRKLLAILYL